MVDACVKNETKKIRLGGRCYVVEHAVPTARWIENARCPLCGGNNLMDAVGMALCVDCNKFVRLKKVE